MSGPGEHTHSAPSAQPTIRRRWRWLLAGALALPPATIGGIWLALPQARPAIAKYAEQGASATKAALAGLTSRFAAEAAQTAPDTVRGVRVMTVRLTEQRAEKRFTGVVAARYETPVGFRVAGKIAARDVEVGQLVRRGDVLMRLDPADYTSALRANEANRAAALAQKVQAEAEEVRQAQLLRQGWTTRATYDRVVAAASSAAEQVRAAAEQVELARNALSYATLISPEDGIITALRAEAGQVIGQGQPVLTLVRSGEREAVVAIPEGQIGDLASWSAEASYWSRGAATEPAILREVSPQADAVSRTHVVRYALPQGAASAELGATVTLTLRQSSGELAATLPANAVFFRDGKPMVWRARPAGDRLEAVPVSVVSLGAQRSTVTGIMDGDRIVTLGVHRLDEGIIVRVVEDSTRPAQAEQAARMPASTNAATAQPITGAEADAICMGQ
jgi:membrane fusion protein, multidrug efflux system